MDLWSPYFLGQLQFAAIAMAGGLVLETVLPGTGKRSYKALGFNLVVAFIFLYLTTLLVPPPRRCSIRCGPISRWPFRSASPTALRVAAANARLLLPVRFFFYWWHRAQHSNALLWAQHKFHHQEQWVNVTTVHRYHFSEEMFRVFVVYLPLAVLFDFRPVTVA
jgi:sterol desaturase/sphingolipid hydroxylase (fatty acid hydroxylase superfamily)